MNLTLPARYAAAAATRNDIVDRLIDRVEEAHADALKLIAAGHEVPWYFGPGADISGWEAWVDTHDISRSLDDNVLVVEDGVLSICQVDPIWAALAVDQQPFGIDYIRVSIKLVAGAAVNVSCDLKPAKYGLHADHEGYWYCLAIDADENCVTDPGNDGGWALAIYNTDFSLPCYVDPFGMHLVPVVAKPERMWDDAGEPAERWMDNLTGEQIITDGSSDFIDFDTNQSVYNHEDGTFVRFATPKDWWLAALQPGWLVAIDRADGEAFALNRIPSGVHATIGYVVAG